LNLVVLFALVGPFAAPDPSLAPEPTSEPDLADEPLVIGPAVAAAPPPIALWARWTSHLAVGLAPSDPFDERALRLGSTLALGLDWTAGDGFEVALETRLRHHLDVLDDSTVSGDFAPEVRRALVRWQPRCGPTLVLGMDVVRWGRTLARPFDVVSPLDWRDGPLQPEGGERVPTFGVSLMQPLGQGEAMVLWTPFFFGSLGPAVANSPIQDGWQSSELAVRVTQRLGDLDIAAGWVWRFDRPLPATSTDAAAERQHVLGLELALSTGPVRWAAEAAFILDQRHYLGAEQVAARPTIRWAFDAAIEPAIFLELTVGLEGAHVLGAAAERTDFEGPDDLSLRARMALLLAYDGVLRLDVDARVGVLRDDWWVTPAFTLRASSSLSLGLGLSAFGGSSGGDPLDLGLASSGSPRRYGGLGALYDRADQLWLRAVWTF